MFFFFSALQNKMPQVLIKFREGRQGDVRPYTIERKGRSATSLPMAGWKRIFYRIYYRMDQLVFKDKSSFFVTIQTIKIRATDFGKGSLYAIKAVFLVFWIS